jgi:uncharacterized protein (DUF488 family)
LELFTIGHSNHTQDKFLDLLIKTKIQVIVDVRSNPNSQWATFANRDKLADILKPYNIQYLYLGAQLGGHPSDPESYDAQTGKAEYRIMKTKASFKLGIQRLMERLKKYKVCIMCAEEDPTACHRNLLIGESLKQEGVLIYHIRGDGRIQTDEDLWKEKNGIAASQISLPI